MNLEVLVDVTSDRFVEKEGARDLWIVTCVLCRDGELEVRRARVELPAGARSGPLVEEDLGELCRGHRLRVRKRTLELPSTFTRRASRVVIRSACTEDLGDCPPLLPWGPGSGPSRSRSVFLPGAPRRGLVFPVLDDLVATVEPCPCDEDSAKWGVRYRERTLRGPGVRLREETVRIDPSCFCCLPREVGTPYPYPYPYSTADLATPGFEPGETTAAESPAFDPIDEGDVRRMVGWLEGPPRSWPRGWHTWPVTREAHRVLAERFLGRIDGAALEGSGRGIVTTGGGRYFRPAYVLLRLLRELGCGLPVEVWHLGPGEMGAERRAALADLGARTVDAEEVRRIHPARILTGWPLKPYSILHSSFREVLWLDADNMPLRDPTYLFDSSPFREVGTLAWPDLNHHRLDPDRQIWEVVGVPHRDEWEWESGQLLVDRARCARALRLTVHYNDHSDFYYHHLYGDKDTFHLAWIRTDTPYLYPARPTRPSSWGLLQYCPVTERPLFQHLAGPGKWGFYEGTRRRDVIRYGDRLGRYLEDLTA